MYYISHITAVLKHVSHSYACNSEYSLIIHVLIITRVYSIYTSHIFVQNDAYTIAKTRGKPEL